MDRNNPPTKPIRIPGLRPRRSSSSDSGLIKNVFQEQKDKYQKEIQDQIQNKLKYVDDKVKAVKSLAGKAEPENLPKKEITPQIRQDRQGNCRSKTGPAGGSTR